MNRACVFCIDDAYVMPFQVFFHSLEATSSIPLSTPLFILHTAALSNHSIAKLRDFLSCYERSASFVDASDLIPADLPIRTGDHVSAATFYRLFIADILPADIDHAVYLDVDMLAIRSIASLFEEPLDELIGAVDHCSTALGLELWGDCGGPYFQAGLLLIPLRVWREMRLADRFLSLMIDKRHRIQFWDQDVLNLALRDRWQRLPIWYNVCEAVACAFPLSEIEQHALLIHYSGSAKPWNSLNPSPFTSLWDAGYQAVFGDPFDRDALRPSSSPPVSLHTRIKSALRKSISGLVDPRS